MSDLPSQLRESVTRKLYASAAAMDWENLSVAEKTAQYRRWVADPQIGGQLTRFLPEDGARVWIKDGPMKEYARAQFGVGAFAHLVDTPRCTPETVVHAVQGPGWDVLAGSIEVKPARCVATSLNGQSLILWGNLPDFKHLVWAALEAASTDDTRPVTIAVVESPARPTPIAERTRLKKIGDRCGFAVRHINPAPVTAATQSPLSTKESLAEADPSGAVD
jgi:hypothetical protein